MVLCTSVSERVEIVEGGIVNDVLFYANRVDCCAKTLKRRQCPV